MNVVYREQHRAEAIARVQAWRAANPERARALDRSQYAKHRAQTIAAACARERAWRQTDVESFRQYKREQMRAWRKANPARAKAIRVRRRAERLEHARAIHRVNMAARRARKAAAAGTPISLADVEALFIAQGQRCVYCSRGIERGHRHLDHVVPLSRGGAHVLSNLVWACPSCNLRKWNHSAVEFMRRLEQETG